MAGDAAASLPELHIKSWAEGEPAKGCEAVSELGGNPEKMVTRKPKEKRLLREEKSILPIYLKNSGHMRTEKCPLAFSALEVTDHLNKSQQGREGGSCKVSKAEVGDGGGSQMGLDGASGEK